MHIDTIPNRNSRPAYLLRESVREGARVKKRTLANLSSLPLDQIEMIRRVLKGEKLSPAADGLEVIASAHHGHVDAVLSAMRRLGFDRLIDAKTTRERDLVVAMVAGRIVAPEASKLGLTRAWADTTLADDMGIADAHEGELYDAKIGCLRGRAQSRNAWPTAICRSVAAYCSISRPARSRVPNARSPNSVTAATASPEPYK